MDYLGDYNSRRMNGSVHVYDHQGNLVCSFNATKDGEHAFVLFQLGLVKQNHKSLYNLDTRAFIVGDVGQLAATIPWLVKP